mgnify:FL=1
MIENKPAKVLFKTIMPVLLLITLVISFDLFFPPIALSDLSYNNVMYKILTDFFDVIILIPFFVFCLSKHLFRFTTHRRCLVFLLLFLSLLFLFLILYNFSFVNVYAAFYYLIVIAFFEEITFRGYMFTVLNQHFSFNKSVVISGIVFGFSHGLYSFLLFGTSIFSVLNFIGGGIIGSYIFSFIYVKTKSLVFPIYFHALLDFCGFVLF